MIHKRHNVWRWYVGLAAVAYSLFSLATISLYQVPWFDEVFYADAAWSFLTNRNFSVPVDFPRTSGEILHSPLFLVIQAGMFELFGMGIWQVRLLPLLSGLAIFLIFSYLVYQITKSDKYTLLFMFLFMSDRVINFSLHSGRMDMLSVFLVMLSILIFDMTLKWKSRVLRLTGAILAGLLLSAGCLTTLRMAVATVPCVLLLFLYKPERRTDYYTSLTVYGAIAALPIVLWLFFAYGGVTGALATEGSTERFASHFGVLSSLVGNVFRRLNEIPKMLLFFGFFAYIFIVHLKRIRNIFWFCMCSLITLGFILFVIEKGPYRAMFFPFVYLTMVISVSLLKRPRMRRIGVATLVSLLGLNVIYSAPRLIGLSVNWRAIQPDRIEEEIRILVPFGSRVITDYRFYYALKYNGCRVLIPNDNEFRIEDFRTNEFRPEYVLGGECTIPGLAGKTEIVQMVGIPPVTMTPTLQRFVSLEHSMAKNHYYAPLLIVKQKLWRHDSLRLPY